MAITAIDIGAAPDDGTGDPLRRAFQITNENFADLDTTKADTTDVANALELKVDKVSGQTLMTSAERTKLAGVATGATANRTDAATDTLLATKVDKVTGQTLMTSAERTKLAGVATGATANRTDAATDTLLATKVDKVTGSRLMTTAEGQQLQSLPAWQKDPTAIASLNGKAISATGAATETAAGLISLATQAQANGGADDTAALTSKKMAGALVSQVVDNDNLHSIRLPGGYLLVQGSTATTTNSAGGGSFVYPVAFLTPPRVVLTLGDNTYRGAIAAIGAQTGADSVGFQLGESVVATVRVNYVAIGKVA